MYYTSLVFFIISLGLSKSSVVVLLASLTPDVKHQKIFRAVIGLMAAWTISSTFAVALQCNLASPWKTIGQRCENVVSPLKYNSTQKYTSNTEHLVVEMADYFFF